VRNIEWEMEEKLGDIQLKFDGEPIKKLKGAPAEAVIDSLNAIQRMVYIIGMSAEGRGLGQRLKPSSKVKREYAVICRAPEFGSHLQPFTVASQGGVFTPAAVEARERLLEALKAFDSGDENRIAATLPNARERWFLADAAKGLLPHEESGLQVMVRAGSRGPFAFSADRARDVITRYRSGPVPEADQEEIIGKVQTINYSQTILVVKPTNNRSIRLDYPMQLESLIQKNVRQRVRLFGKPKLNNVGDITSFENLISISEIEGRIDPISKFKSGRQILHTNRPLSLPISFEFDTRLFTFRDNVLGIDAFSEQYDSIREIVLEELDILWRNYALAPQGELALDARALKSALTTRFKALDA
jgi:hypothetical protein